MSTLSSQDVSVLKTMVEEKWPRFSIESDWDKLTGMFTDDVVFMPPDEPAIKGKAAVKAWLEKFPSIEAQTVALVHAEGCEYFACARGTVGMKVVSESGEPLSMTGKWFASYRKQSDGIWLLATDIWNMDAPVTSR